MTWCRGALKTPVLSCLKPAQLSRWCVWLSHPCFISKINNDVMFSFCSVIKIPNKLDWYSNLLEFYLSFKLKAVLFLSTDNSSLKMQGGECVGYKTCNPLLSCCHYCIAPPLFFFFYNKVCQLILSLCSKWAIAVLHYRQTCQLVKWNINISLVLQSQETFLWSKQTPPPASCQVCH